MSALKVVHLAKRGDLPKLLTNMGESAVQVVDGEGKVVSATKQLAGRRIFTFSPPSDHPRAVRTKCDVPGFPDTCVHVVGYRVYDPAGDPGKDWMIYTAEPADELFIHPYIPHLFVGLTLLVVGITAVSTYRVVGQALAPVDEITKELAEITETHLERRVPLPEHHDEIRELAETANRTLDRLENAVEQQRRFASDASHDLRSPLTAMRTELEEAALHPEDANWPRTADFVLDGIDRVQSIIADLLFMAKLEGGDRAPVEDVDLGRLVDETVAGRHDRIRIKTVLRPGLVATCNRLRIERVLANVLDNAERHASSAVTVTARADGGDAVIDVHDDGSGVPGGQREKIFERFVRLSESRTLDAAGTGLGLPIARQIARQHGGALTLEDSDRGALFRLRLPLRRGDRPPKLPPQSQLPADESTAVLD